MNKTLAAVKTTARKAFASYCTTCGRIQPLDHTCKIQFTKRNAARLRRTRS